MTGYDSKECECLVSFIRIIFVLLCSTMPHWTYTSVTMLSLLFADSLVSKEVVKP